MALGYGGTALSYDVNALFLNSANLTAQVVPVSGYQFQYNYLEYLDFNELLSDTLSYDLANFESLALEQKTDLVNGLAQVFDSKFGFYGSQGNVPGFVSRNFGFSASFVKTAVVHPVQSDIFGKDINEITNADISSLNMNFIGLNYRKFTFAYAARMTQTVSVGVSLHYLKGNAREFRRSIVDSTFQSNNDSKDYLEVAWDEADQGFSKIIADISAVMDIGRFFRVGVVMRNFGSPTIKLDDAELTINKRIIAGIAFRPKPEWSIYLDVDIDKGDLLLNGNEMQPISIGVERSFFNNTFFLRMGMLNDLTEKKFLGSDSSALFGFGLGFNMSNIMVDAALGLDSGGALKSLAISGHYILK
jgi:hypothetical protein